MMTEEAARLNAVMSWKRILLSCLLAGSPLQGAEVMDYAVTEIRVYPMKGGAEKMVRGRITGSLTSPTNDFQEIAKIEEAPAEGEWTVIRVKKPAAYRFVKYEAPPGSHGAIAEIEFYAGERKLTGSGFGTTGSRNDAGTDWSKALDGDVATFFEGKEANNQYVGLDLGEASQVAAVTLDVAGGVYAAAQSVTLATATPGAEIRYNLDGRRPEPGGGRVYQGPVAISSSAILVAVAFKPGLAPSVETVAAYRIGEPSREERGLTTFHIGNSLTDTIDGWLKPLAESAGRKLNFRRFTIPGAPTDWLWNHPGTGFGDNRYVEAFLTLAPIDHITTQPFAGHDRSISNEAAHSLKFYEEARRHSPDIQPWLYVQWPGPEFKDNWSQGRGSASELNLTAATSWQEGVANHLRYTEAVRDKIMETWTGRPVRIVPGGTGLALLKTEVEAGRVPGMSDFIADVFADGIHMTPKGRYMVACVFYAAIYGESPEGKVSPLNSGLSEEQAKIFQRLAWQAVQETPSAGVAAKN